MCRRWSLCATTLDAQDDDVARAGMMTMLLALCCSKPSAVAQSQMVVAVAEWFTFFTKKVPDT